MRSRETLGKVTLSVEDLAEVFVAGIRLKASDAPCSDCLSGGLMVTPVQKYSEFALAPHL